MNATNTRSLRRLIALTYFYTCKSKYTGNLNVTEHTHKSPCLDRKFIWPTFRIFECCRSIFTDVWKCNFISAIYIFWFPYQNHTCQIWKSKHSLVYKFKNFFYENNTEGNKSKAYITLISHFVQSNINLIKLGLTCYSNLTKECSSYYDVLHVYVYQTSLGTNSRMKIDLFNLKYW